MGGSKVNVLVFIFLNTFSENKQPRQGFYNSYNYPELLISVLRLSLVYHTNTDRDWTKVETFPRIKPKALHMLKKTCCTTELHL
jgi:hypothetical protein